MQLSKEKLVKMLKNDPKNPKTLIALGKLYMSQDRVKDAIDCFNRASVFAPNSMAALINLGNAYLRFGKIEAAHATFRKANLLDGNNADAVYSYAGTLMVLGEYDSAIDCYLRALGLDKDKVFAATASIAEAMEKQGNPEQAFEKISPFLDQGVTSPEISMALAQLALNHEQYSDYQSVVIGMLEDLVHSSSLEKTLRARLYFKLGHLYRKQNNYDLSFEAFERAHELIRLDCDLGEIEESIKTLKEGFAAIEPPGAPAGKCKNIFILGMPRSGTSLIEKIIGVNSDVLSLGECNFFHHSVCEVADDSDVQWGCKAIDAPQLLRVRSLYKQKYLVANKPSRSVCDKSLENVFLVGQILQVFPEARLVWTKRDLRDVCLSCYASDFAGQHSYTHDLKTLAKYAMLVEDLMAYWQKKFPDNFHVVPYEDFVNAPDPGIRALIDFLGFPWDDRFLASHTAENRVRTLSYNDVQQPVYSRAVGKWKHYEKHLAPLLEELQKIES